DVNEVLDSNVVGDRATVTLGRTMTAEAKKKVGVTVVRLAKWHDAWVVVGADDAGGLLKFASPQAGTTISSPTSVSGPGSWGVDEAAKIEVRTAKTGDVLGTGHASWGNG